MTEVLLVETDCFSELDLSQKSAMEKAVGRVPGLRFYRAGYPSRAAALQQPNDTILVITLEMPAEKKEMGLWLDAVVESRPLPTLCGLCFVLRTSPRLDPRTWESEDWVELLDRFSEIALPSSLVVWSEDDSRLNFFRLVESLSSLVREMDSLNELRKLDHQIQLVEEHLGMLQKQIKGA